MHSELIDTPHSALATGDSYETCDGLHSREEETESAGCSLQAMSLTWVQEDDAVGYIDSNVMLTLWGYIDICHNVSC